MKSDMLLMRAPYVMLTLNLSKFKLVALCRTISQVKTLHRENLKLKEEIKI